tara:strand:+ start:9837 stop:10733 length:897 start_codon:yes stop_codon:yes gene_type:complete
MNKPNLFIAGFPKCGSSALHKMISQHSEIYGESFKETQTYTLDRKYRDRFNPSFKFSYPNLYSSAKGEKYLLDSSTSYSVNLKAIRRINKDSPQAKFIYVVRDPLDRLISHYRWMASLGFVEKRFQDEIMSDLKYQYNDQVQYWGNYKNYVYHGSYGFHLENLFSVVDRSRVYIVNYKSLKDNYLDVVKGIFTFLDLEQESVTQVISNSTKKSFSPKQRSIVDRLKYRASRLKAQIKSQPVSPKIKRPLKDVSSINLDETFFLKDILTKEISKCESLGISTESWANTRAVASGSFGIV